MTRLALIAVLLVSAVLVAAGAAAHLIAPALTLIP